MNPFHNPLASPRDIDTEPAFDPIVNALQTAFHAPVPTMRFNPLAAAPDVGPSRAVRPWKPVVAFGVVAALVLAAITVPLISDGGAQPASAQEILAKVAAGSRQPYHVLTAGGRGDYTWEMESWYANSLTVRMEERDYVNGQLTSTFGVVRDGTEFWMYNIDKTGVWVTHATNQGSEPVPGLGPDPFLGVSSLADATSFLSGATSSCTPVTRQPDAVVDGRNAYVLVAGPWIPGCVDPRIRFQSSEPFAGSLVFWLDQETLVALKEQSQDASGVPIDNGYFREVRTLDVGPVDASVFNYTPPAGANVKEVVGKAP